MASDAKSDTVFGIVPEFGVVLPWANVMSLKIATSVATDHTSMIVSVEYSSSPEFIIYATHRRVAFLVDPSPPVGVALSSAVGARLAALCIAGAFGTLLGRCRVYPSKVKRCPDGSRV